MLKREKEVIVSGTWEPREFREMVAPFRERYPFINVRYEWAGTSGRGMQVLVALNEGRVLVDVMTSIADAISYYTKPRHWPICASFPGSTILPRTTLPQTDRIGHKLSFRCMAYNTNLVKKADLPRTWDDLLNANQWGKGNLALTNNPSAWLLGLWVNSAKSGALNLQARCSENRSHNDARRV